MRKLLELGESMMVTFVAAGLDIRRDLSDSVPSVDATAWHQDEALYERAKIEFGLQENFLQLLHASKEEDIRALAGLFTPGTGRTLLTLELLEATLEAYSPSHPALPLPAELTWETLGFDVCDINGFFSFLAMDVRGSDRKQLFREDQLLDAFALSEVANIRVPAHRPFVIVKLKRLLPRES